MSRPQNPDRADDVFFGVTIGCDHQRTAGIHEHSVFGADEDLHPVTVACRLEKAQRILAGFKFGEQLPDRVELFAGLNIVEQIGLPAHHQHRLLGRGSSGPQPHTRLDKLARHFIEFGPMGGDFGANHAGGRQQVAAPSPTAARPVAGR